MKELMYIKKYTNPDGELISSTERHTVSQETPRVIQELIDIEISDFLTEYDFMENVSIEVIKIESSNTYVPS